MNGQEKDDEIASGIYSALFWEYDSRLGRRWNMDPEPVVGVSDYACFLNNPIAYADPLGNHVDVGKKKENDKTEKKKVSVGERYVPNIDKTKSKNGGKEEVSVFDLANRKETYYTVDGKEVSEKAYNKAVAFNDKIDDNNDKINKYNAIIDAKIAFFNGAGFEAKYDANTGLINSATKSGELNAYQQTLFDAVNSSKTYGFNVGGTQGFSFDGKNSFTLSEAALSKGDRPILYKMVASDAEEFLGRAQHDVAGLKYFNITIPSAKFYIEGNKVGFKYKLKGGDSKGDYRYSKPFNIIK